jgi:predicted dehydrogenase
MLKVGLIGCGKITQVRHAPEYAEHPDVRLVGYYDEDPQRSQAMAEEFGGVAFDSVEELLGSGVDAVSVCVANVAHAEMSIRALKAGIHVLCEKPMATTLQECEDMISAAKLRGKRLLIGQNQRLAKAHVKARELIQSGEIGRVITFRTTFGHPGPEGWTGQKSSWFFHKKRAAFGTMADLGVHKTDLIHYLLDDEIDEVMAKIATLDKQFPDGSPIEVDDNAYCICKTKQGVVGTMHVSWTFYGEEDNSTILYGTKGVLRCYTHPQYSLILEGRDGSKTYYQLDQLTSNKEQTSGGRTSTGVIDTFVAALLSGEKTSLDAEESIKAMRVIFAAQESAQKGCAVQISDATQRVLCEK